MTKTEKAGKAVTLPAHNDLFATVCGLIEDFRRSLARQVNSTTVFLFWRIGQQINNDVLHLQRAEYGQKIVTTLATQLSASYGRSFEARNLRRMMQFAEQFPDFGIVSPLATQLSWSHIIEVLPLKTPEALLFYLGEAANRQLGKREMRQLIARLQHQAMIAKFKAAGIDAYIGHALVLTDARQIALDELRRFANRFRGLLHDSRPTIVLTTATRRATIRVSVVYA